MRQSDREIQWPKMVKVRESGSRRSGDYAKDGGLPMPLKKVKGRSFKDSQKIFHAEVSTFWANRHVTSRGTPSGPTRAPHLNLSSNGLDWSNERALALWIRGS